VRNRGGGSILGRSEADTGPLFNAKPVFSSRGGERRRARDKNLQLALEESTGTGIRP
jgi:hypothetical protein